MEIKVNQADRDAGAALANALFDSKMSPYAAVVIIEHLARHRQAALTEVGLAAKKENTNA